MKIINEKTYKILEADKNKKIFGTVDLCEKCLPILYMPVCANVEKIFKKFQKTLKKVLTIKSGCGIITKLSAKSGQETVIEN